jgi:hypothetical protein
MQLSVAGQVIIVPELCEIDCDALLDRRIGAPP